MSLGGTFSFPGTNLTVHRMGYGAMQLAGPHVFGPPRDRNAAIAVLRAAVQAGVDHIDTSDFYGPHVTNQIIREALHPYPEGLVIVTKVSARRDDAGGWLPALSPEELTEAVHSNLRNLGLDSLPVVNFRSMHGQFGAAEGSIAAQIEVLAELKRQGLIQNIGVSNVTRAQIAEAESITPIVCVQNLYNVVNRGDDDLIDELAERGIPYVPWFPLGGINPLQSAVLDEVAAAAGATRMQVALAWLLHRAPNILLIPGTSSVDHLKENLAAAELPLSAEEVKRLDALAHRNGAVQER